MQEGLVDKEFKSMSEINEDQNKGSEDYRKTKTP